jgi:hypothetical protein
MDDLVLKKVVDANLRKLVEKGEGHLYPFLIGESQGRTSYKGFSCKGANFHVDPETGEIQYFENPQYVPREIREKYAEAGFEIATDTFRQDTDPTKSRNHIVRLYNHKGLTKNAVTALEKTIEEYNSRHSFIRKEK